MDFAGGRQARGPRYTLGGDVAGVNVGDDGPAILVQHADETAGGFLGVAEALVPAGYYPCHLGRARTWATDWHGGLQGPGRCATGAHAYYPVAPEFAAVG